MYFLQGKSQKSYAFDWALKLHCPKGDKHTVEAASSLFLFFFMYFVPSFIDILYMDVRLLSFL